MKRVIEQTDENCFEKFLGERIVLFCGIYIYTGTLTGVNDVQLELTDAKIIYETGELTTGEWGNAQELLSPYYIMVQAVESYGPAKC